MDDADALAAVANHVFPLGEDCQEFTCLLFGKRVTPESKHRDIDLAQEYQRRHSAIFRMDCVGSSPNPEGRPLTRCWDEARAAFCKANEARCILGQVEHDAVQVVGRPAQGRRLGMALPCLRSLGLRLFRPPPPAPACPRLPPAVWPSLAARQHGGPGGTRLRAPGARSARTCPTPAPGPSREQRARREAQASGDEGTSGALG